MKLLSKCPNCKKRSIIICKRSYKIPQINTPIKSKGDLCWGCYKKIKTLLK